MMFRIFMLTALSALTLANSPLHAGYSYYNGKVINTDYLPCMSVQEHFEAGMQAIQNEQWDAAETQFTIVAENFPSTPYGQEASYFLGVAQYELEEYDFANESFSNYLKSRHNPRYFMEAIEYKFRIAECFKNGAKRRFFCTKQLPKWASGTSNALEIYDEVIAALPCHELAARALFAKGNLLWSMREFRDSVDAFQMITRRFPKNELAPESYILINRVYLDQCRYEFQNPDILALAKLNTRRFQQAFPREERLAEAELDVNEIEEVYAGGLYSTGRFYERTDKPLAAAIYYQNAINRFPDTHVADLCRSRVECLAEAGIVAPSAPTQNKDDLEDLDPELNEDEDLE